MSSRPRCHDCGHPVKRRITATRQTEGKPQQANVAARVRKKSCDCVCHEAAT